MKRPLYETKCPATGWTIVSYPWFARWQPKARMRCSGCGAIVPSESHGVIKRVELDPVPLEQRIAREAERIQAEQGITAIAALAAAEAVETGREHGLRYDRVEFDEEQLQWWAFYESGGHRHPVMICLPLVHATEATQTGIASLN